LKENSISKCEFSFCIYIGLAAHRAVDLYSALADAPRVVGSIFFYRYIAPLALLIVVKCCFVFEDVFFVVGSIFLYKFVSG
jgi:hypothetical protein